MPKENMIFYEKFHAEEFLAVDTTIYCHKVVKILFFLF